MIGWSYPKGLFVVFFLSFVWLIGAVGAGWLSQEFDVPRFMTKPEHQLLAAFTVGCGLLWIEYELFSYIEYNLDQKLLDPRDAQFYLRLSFVVVVTLFVVLYCICLNQGKEAKDKLAWLPEISSFAAITLGAVLVLFMRAMSWLLGALGSENRALNGAPAYLSATPPQQPLPPAA